MAEGDSDDEITLRDDNRGLYKKIVLRDGKLVGAVLYGDVADGQWYLGLMRDKTDISEIRDKLVFGRAFAESLPAGKTGPMSRPCRTTRRSAAATASPRARSSAPSRKRSLASLSQVRAHTKASASCGQCTGLVEALLARHAGRRGGEESARRSAIAPRPAMTKCARRSWPRASRPWARCARRFGWKKAEGCHKCRPALNYYLLCAWPGEYVDDSRSRFVNERVHANIQKDGTY